MQERESLKLSGAKKRAARSAKECAFIAVFVALIICAQFALSFVPGVEIVTLLFVVFSFSMGIRRGVISALAFAFLRQIVFGFAPTVLILYLIYFPLLSLTFGMLGHKIKNPLKFLLLIVLVACLCTVVFTMIDNVLTPLWYGYGEKSTRLYFMASLPFMIPQVICTAISVGCLFYPLHKIFINLKTKLEN